MRPQRSLTRKINTRAKRRKIFIYCEGLSTEPLYLKAYEAFVSSSVLELVCYRGQGVPKTLTDKAIEKAEEIRSKAYQKENGSRDAVWVVFDHDEHPRVGESIRACKEKNVGVAYSNPCFELWLLLHIEDYDKDEHRSETQKRCELVCEGYSAKKGKSPNLRNLMLYVEAAEGRARALRARREEDGSASPFTTVDQLTIAIRSPNDKPSR